MLAADQLAGFLEDTGDVLFDQPVKRPADGRVGSDAASTVRTAADGADAEFRPSHRDGALGTKRRQGLFDPFPPFPNGGLGAADFLDDDGRNRAPGSGDGLLELAMIDALAAQRDQQDGPGIGVCAKRAQHPDTVGVRIASAESDDLNLARLVPRPLDAATDVMCAFH